MKFSALTLLSTLALTQLGFADFKIPKSVFTMDDLPQAIEEASAEEEPLIFVYTNPGTT